MGLIQDTLGINATQHFPPLYTVGHSCDTGYVEGKARKKTAPGKTVREHKLWSSISPYNLVNKTKQNAHLALSVASTDCFSKLGYIYHHSYY